MIELLFILLPFFPQEDTTQAIEGIWLKTYVDEICIDSIEVELYFIELSQQEFKTNEGLKSQNQELMRINEMLKPK